MNSAIAGVRLRRGDLVAVQLPPGLGWPRLLEAVWDAGAALLPLDTRLSPPELARGLAATRTTVLVAASGARRDRTGAPVDDDTAVVVASSGSTGSPRFAMFSRQAVTAAVHASAQ